MSTGSIPQPLARAALDRPRDRASRIGARLLARPELLGLLGVTAILNLWNLGINGWANTYYSAAVRSMSTSWHDFLFASLDKTGLMTVDKPPLAFWVQALSVRVFGYHPLSILIPEALMGIVAVGLMYDLVARRFGRVAGLVGGLAFALTPVTVAVARHNNPDELLILCSVAAVWAVVRGLDTGRARWLVLSGVLVGLGFETKMGVALLLVPGIAAAWWWSARGSLWTRTRQLLGGGAAMLVVALAWPLAVTLTPAADRPWISGTSDNSIWSLIFGYNGLGRVAGQSGGPSGGFGGTMFGGPTGPFRLLQTGLGDQAGWLLGFAAVIAGRARGAHAACAGATPAPAGCSRSAARCWSPAVVFSFASGIFHPYYVSFLAPFTAALVGAGAGLMLEHRPSARVIAPLAIAGGVVTEFVVLNDRSGQLGWAVPFWSWSAARAPSPWARPPAAAAGGAGGDRVRRAARRPGDVGRRDARSRHELDLPHGRSRHRVRGSPWRPGRSPSLRRRAPGRRLRRAAAGAAALGSLFGGGAGGPGAGARPGAGGAGGPGGAGGFGGGPGGPDDSASVTAAVK